MCNPAPSELLESPFGKQEAKTHSEKTIKNVLECSF